MRGKGPNFVGSGHITKLGSLPFAKLSLRSAGNDKEFECGEHRYDFGAWPSTFSDVATAATVP